jgi:hypothetical protein
MCSVYEYCWGKQTKSPEQSVCAHFPWRRRFCFGTAYYSGGSSSGVRLSTVMLLTAVVRPSDSDFSQNWKPDYTFRMIPSKGSMNYRQSTHHFDKPVELHWWIHGDKVIGYDRNFFNFNSKPSAEQFHTGGGGGGVDLYDESPIIHLENLLGQKFDSLMQIWVYLKMKRNWTDLFQQRPKMNSSGNAHASFVFWLVSFR